MDITEGEEEDTESVTLEERVPNDESSGQASVEPEQGTGEEIFLPTTKGMFKKGDRLKINVNQEWRQVTIRSCYRKNKQSNYGSIYNVIFSDSDSNKMFLFDLDKVAWAEPETEMSTVPASKVKIMTKEQLEVLVTTIPYFQHGIPEIREAKNKEIQKLESFGAFKPVQLSSLSEDQKAKVIATTWTVVHKPHANDGKGDLVTVEGEGGAMAILEWTSTKLKVPANSPLNGESEASMAAQVVEEDNMTISWLSGALQPADILTKPAVNSRIVKTLMRSEMFGMPTVFMIWFFLMMMFDRIDLQFFSLNAVKERTYDRVNKEVVE